MAKSMLEVVRTNKDENLKLAGQLYRLGLYSLARVEITKHFRALYWKHNNRHVFTVDEALRIADGFILQLRSRHG